MSVRDIVIMSMFMADMTDFVDMNAILYGIFP